MSTLLIAIAIIAVFSAISIIALRIFFINKAEALLTNLNNIPPYLIKTSDGQIQESALLHSNSTFIDIPTSLNDTFHGKIILSAQGLDFANYYSAIYQKSCSLVGNLKILEIDPPEQISNLIYDFEHLNNLIQQHNESVIHNLLRSHKDFFDNCLKYPLDNQQRRAILSEEDNCLVISSAGSGKTSSIIGKVKYLTEIKGIDPERILLISYTNKAASELTERIGTDGIRGYTFHKLAIDIIGKLTGTKPSICENMDALLVEIYHNLLKETSFKESILKYFTDYQNDNIEWKRREQLSEQKNTRLKAILPDMDGRTVYVRSQQEQKICFLLSSFGVNFRYEEAYEHELANELHSQYHPDFSIYFEKDGERKRIYLEHFGVNNRNLVPVWFAKDLNISYEEANKKYNDGITWKKAAHEKFGTKLIVTSSADFYNSDIKEKLRNLLYNAGVPIQEKTEDELYDLILPRGGKQEKAIIRLIITFITLVKSSCKSVEDILKHAEVANDERSIHIIKGIIQPMYNNYVQALGNLKKLDFTDLILEAAKLYRTNPITEYDYIIVDEFQDISIDRYKFLKALRDSNHPAKLYCVGDDWQSIYRFSGSDMALFNQFSEYFGATEINKIETTYRFGEPLISISSRFIQRNDTQLKKNIRSSDPDMRTTLEFLSYGKYDYCRKIEQLIASIPLCNSILLLGRYSFDDYYLSFTYKSIKEGNRFFYIISERKIEFLTVHKAKGLQADYVILLQCNNDIYGFPSMVSDDSVLNYVLTKSDQFPYGEERRLFYVAITRAMVKTIILYEQYLPSVFVIELLHPERLLGKNNKIIPNANKQWTSSEDKLLLELHKKGKSIKDIAAEMGRSYTSIVMRLGKRTTH